MLPPKPDEVRDLLKNVTDAASASGVDIRDLPLAQDHPWVEDVAPLLFAATTQGFVDFGNLVGSAFPELLSLIAAAQADPVPSVLREDRAACESETKAAIASVLQALRADADEQRADVAAAESALHAHAVEAKDANRAQLDQVIAATGQVIDCWDRIAEELARLEARVARDEHIDVAALRAVPAIWQRIVVSAIHVQAMQDAALPPAGAALRIVPRSEP